MVFPCLRQGSLFSRALLLGICLQTVPMQSTDIKLGYLYIQSGPGEATNWGASWVQESFSQFKLGILDVNADSTILPNHTLSFQIADTSGDEAVALKSATSLVNDVVGIVGTGYSSALRLPGGYCGVFKKPMVSPGSTLLSLIDKTPMPYVMRSIPSDAGVLKAMVATIYDLGWRRSVVMVHKGFEDGAIQVLRPAMVASGIAQLTLVYGDPDDSDGNPIEANRKDLQEKMKLIKSSGYRIIALYSKGVDFHAINDTSSKADVGFWSSQHVWVLASSGWVSPLHHAPQVFSAVAESPKTARKAWYDERWTRVSTLWDASIHGGYDPVTKLPFFGQNATKDFTVWDTDYAQKGDGKPDMWGEYVYDTVWLYAHAMHAMILSGKDVHDGEELRKQLLETKFEGITGNLVFDQASQDRIAPIVIYMSSANGPLQAGAGTENLETWDLNGPCVKGCTTLSPGTVTFPGGRVPSDGRALDVQKSFFSSGSDTYTEGDKITIIVQVRDSFSQVPCQSLCSANASSTSCSTCLEQFAAYEEVVPIIETHAGEALMSAKPLVYDAQAVSGTLRITLPAGVSGGDKQDRQVVLKLRYRSDLFELEYKLSLKSRACLAGFHEIDGGCAQCRAGTFTAVRGATACETCQEGEYQDADGATSCIGCQPGKFQDSKGMTQCLRCKAGFYTDGSKSASCIACDVHRTTAYEGATGEDACVCEPEYYEAHQFPSTHHSHACLPCPKGYECLGLQKGVRVKDGFYVSLPLDPAKGAWECRPKHFCTGASEVNISVQTICAKDSTGQNCAQCVEGTYLSGAVGRCEKCEDGDPALLPLAFIAVFALCGFFHIMWNYRSNTVEAIESVLASITLGVTISFIQQLGIIDNCRFHWPKEFQELLNMFKMLIFDFGFLKYNCLYEQTLASSYLTKLFVPIVIAGIFLVWWVLSKPVHMMIKRFPSFSMDTIQNSICMIMQAVYISIVASTVSLFECYQSGPNDETILVRYPWVKCSDSKRMAMMPFAVAALLFYVIGFFVYLCYLSYMAPVKALDEGFQCRIRFLIFKFRPDTWWYGLVLLVRALGLGLVPVLVPEDGYIQLILVQFIFIASVFLHLCIHPYQDAYANHLESGEMTLMLVILGLGAWFIEDRDYDAPDIKDQAFRLSVALVATVAVCVAMLAGVFVWAVTLIAKPKFAKALVDKQVQKVSPALKSMCEEVLQLDDDGRSHFVQMMTYIDWGVIKHLSHLVDLELKSAKSSKRISRSDSKRLSRSSSFSSNSGDALKEAADPWNEIQVRSDPAAQAETESQETVDITL